MVGAIGFLGQIGRTGLSSPSRGGGVPVPAARSVDVAGPELITNGSFAGNITGWTDASSAGGDIAYSSGRMAVTNTSGTARGRQVVAGAGVANRYAFMVKGFSTVNGSVTVGSTAGGSDYLNKSVQAAIPAQAGIAEFAATTTSVSVQMATGVVGTTNWDDATLRQLIPTTFDTGKVFSDDFTVKPDGGMGVTPDGLLWRYIDPSNGAIMFPLIVSGKLTTAASGSTSTAAYPYLHMGDGKATGIHCDLAWTGTGAAVAMVSLQPTGGIPTVANIVANSLHIVFTDTKVDITTYTAGVTTTETVTYAAPCATDGTVYPDVGWFLDGNTLTLKLPDGSTVQRTEARFAPMIGAVAIPEQFYATGVTGTVAIIKASVRLG